MVWKLSRAQMVVITIHIYTRDDDARKICSMNVVSSQELPVVE